jgi:hypothetical protein
MEPEIEFNPAAFKHGVSEADIRHTLGHARYDGIMGDENNKHLSIGFDTRGNLLEVLYNEAGAKGLYVFHAMKRRKAYLPLLTV